MRIIPDNDGKLLRSFASNAESQGRCPWTKYLQPPPGSDVNVVELTAEITSAFVSNNAVPIADLPKLITDVHDALAGLQSAAAQTQQPELKPAVPVKKSVFPDYIICLEDGKQFKSLKRHLRTHFDMSPQEYREKWGLPADYPMVAASYSARRSKLAKSIGLGRKGR